MRIDKLLAKAGLGSRKEVKKLLRTGAISLAGKTIKDAGTLIPPEQYQELALQGSPLSLRHSLYLLLHKPAGYVTALTDRQAPTVAELLPDEFCFADLRPVGRLDIDTTGLLLFTNDGSLLHRLTAPKWEIPKTYAVGTEGRMFTEADKELFLSGIKLDDGQTKPADLIICSPHEAHLTITEGRNHQVKRMMLATGRKVTSLKRLSFGPLDLTDLDKPFDIREATDAEVEALYRATNLERPQI